MFLGVCVFAEEETMLQQCEEKKLIAVDIPSENFDIFYRFVETGEPTISNISTLCYTYEFTYTNNGEKAIKEICAGFPTSRLYTHEGGEGYTWEYQGVAGLCNYETLDYFMHTANIQELLDKNGIEDSVNNYMFVTLSPYIFPFIWVNTDQGNYYIVLEKAEDGNKWIGYNNFTYHIYDVQTMLETRDIINEKAKTPPIEIVVDLGRVVFDTPPIVKNERILVPVRALCERMGATVNWDENAQTVTVTREETTIIFKIDDKVAEVNGVKYDLDVAPEIMNDRTLVPLRFVAENLEYLVVWVHEERVELYSHYNKDTVNRTQ